MLLGSTIVNLEEVLYINILSNGNLHLCFKDKSFITLSPTSEEYSNLLKYYDDKYMYESINKLFDKFKTFEKTK